MDPSIIIDHSSFSTPNPSSYSLTELWPPPFPPNSHHLPGVLGLQMTSLTPADSIPAAALSVDESTVTDQSSSLLFAGAGCRKKRKDTSSEDDSSKLASTSTPTHFNDTNAKRMKASRGGREENDGSKTEGETSSQTGNKNPSDQQNIKPEPPKDYIHVRARRGQATDSHSLAERARREKISERMKILQDLVPGCNKVIGKALVLDEIINYIQSLQHQVEFLSMKLEAVNSRMNPGIEGFPSKDLAAPPFDATAIILGQQAPREYGQAAHPEWLHMQVGSNFQRAT